MFQFALLNEGFPFSLERSLLLALLVFILFVLILRHLRVSTTRPVAGAPPILICPSPSSATRAAALTRAPALSNLSDLRLITVCFCVVAAQVMRHILLVLHLGLSAFLGAL